MAAPTTRSVLQLQNDVLSRVGEAASSPVGQLPDGTDDTPTEDTPTAIRRYMNEGLRKLIRAAYPLRGTGTFTAPTGTTGFVRFNQFDCGDGSVLWAVRKVSVAGVGLLRASRSAAEINTTSGFSVWIPDGASGISLTVPMTNAQVCVADGFVVPPAKVADGDVFPWIEADLDYLLVDYAAATLCLKAFPTDEVLGGLAAVWQARFDKGVATQNARLRATDPALWATHFSYPLPMGK